MLFKLLREPIAIIWDHFGTRAYVISGRNSVPCNLTFNLNFNMTLKIKMKFMFVLSVLNLTFGQSSKEYEPVAECAANFTDVTFCQNKI